MNEWTNKPNEWKKCGEDLWDETLMIIRPCHKLLKAENDRVVGGWW